MTATVSGLPTNGSTLYVRIWSLINGGWLYNDYTYKATTLAATSPAQLLSPAPGSTLSASTVQLQYSGGTGVSQYWVSLGKTVGGYDLFSQDRGTSLTATVSGLPTNGSTLYVRLWSLINGSWQYNDYTYKATTVATTAPAQLLSPASGSTLTGSTVQLQYSSGTGVSQYWVYVGTSVGVSDLFSQDRGTSLTATVSGLPTNGSTLYVRLWSLINGGWLYYDYTYKATTVASTAPAQIISPAPGSTLTGSTVQLQYSSGTGVSQYWVYVGTTAGGNNLFSQSQGTSLTATVSGLPTNGSTLYVRLRSLINGSWQYNDYTYKAATVAATSPARIESPSAGSTLSGSSQTFKWSTGQGVSQYFLYVGTSLGSNDIYGNTVTGTSATVGSLPTNGWTIYVRLHSLIGGAWQSTDVQFKAATGSATKKCGDARDTMIAEYESAAVLKWIPTCDDFAKSGGTANFSWSELNRSPGSGHPPFGIVTTRLWEGLERTRAEYGGLKLTVQSGYRCPHGNSNSSIKGSPTSRHQFGDAVDITPTVGAWNHTVWAKLNLAAVNAGATWTEDWGTGTGQTVTHVHAQWTN